MKTAIVTGGARGIGKAIVEELAKAGINVIANYNNSKKQAEQLKETLKKQGYNIEIYKADVSKKEEVKKTGTILIEEQEFPFLVLITCSKTNHQIQEVYYAKLNKIY